MSIARSPRRLVSAFLALLLIGALAPAASAGASSKPLPPALERWISFADDGLGVEEALRSFSSKVSPDLVERLRFALPDGRLRVMVSLNGRTKTTEAEMLASTTALKWYGADPRFLGMVTPDQFGTLLKRPDVLFVEPDYPIVHSMSVSSVDVNARSLANDGSAMWSLVPPSAQDPRGRLASDTSLPVDYSTGKDVTVAVVDSGIDRTHRDFGGWDCEPGPYEPCESRIERAVSVEHLEPALVLPDTPTTEAFSGHGTHVAGTIAGNGFYTRDGDSNATTYGGDGFVMGVAPQASLINVKNGDSQWAGLGSFALQWVKDHAAEYDIRVVSNSWGCPLGCAFSGTSATGLLLKDLYDAGVLVTFAVGNDGGTESGTAFSGNAQSPYVLGVASYAAANHQLASSSSRGLGTTTLDSDPASWTPESEGVNGVRRPDIAAPGVGIWSARTLTGGTSSLVPRVNTSDVIGGGTNGTIPYVSMGGTSMATPHVSGAAALLFGACQNATVLDVMRAVKVGADQDVKTTNGSRLGLPYEVGYGGLNIRDSFDWLLTQVPCGVPRQQRIELFEGTGTIDHGNPAASETQTAFLESCAVPANQGTDGWVFDLGQPITDPTALAGLTGTGSPSHDLDMYFYDEDCTQLGDPIATTAANESGPVPAGSKWVVANLFYGITTDATLRITAVDEPQVVDSDGDGFSDDVDNCPDVANPGQEDSDEDDVGDACDTAPVDTDGDGVSDDEDNCPNVANPGQADADSDGNGDACDSDRDGDGVADATDNCPNVANPGQADADSDGTGDACDSDRDGDGVANDTDNCPDVANGGQEDEDSDNVGDACESADPIAHTLYMDGTHPAGEIDQSPLGGYLQLNETAGSAEKSMMIPNYVGGPNVNCAGNSLLPVFVGDLNGRVVGDLEITFPAVASAESVEIRVWPDVTAQRCNADYPAPAGSAQVVLPEGPGTVEATIPDLDFVAKDALMIQITPILASGPGYGRVFYGTDTSKVTFGFIPVPDRDDDGVVDNNDNCPDDANRGQEDSDGDGAGDMCDEFTEPGDCGGTPADHVYFLGIGYDDVDDPDREDFLADMRNFEVFRAALGETYCIPPSQATILAMDGQLKDSVSGANYADGSEANLKAELRRMGKLANQHEDSQFFFFLSSHGSVDRSAIGNDCEEVRVGSYAALKAGGGENGLFDDCELGYELNTSFDPSTRMFVAVDCSFCGGFSDSLTAVSGTIPDDSLPSSSGIPAPNRVVVTGCAMTTECFGSEPTSEGGVLYDNMSDVIEGRIGCDGWTAPGFPEVQGFDIPTMGETDDRCTASEWFFGAVQSAYDSGDPIAVQQQFRIKYGMGTLENDIVIREPKPDPVAVDTAVVFTDGSADGGQFSDEATIAARLTDADGAPIEGAELVFQLAGAETSSWTEVTGADGVATATRALSEAPGDYQLTVHYADEAEVYEPSSDGGVFVIWQEDSTAALDAAAPSGKGKKATRTLTATISDPDGSSFVAGRVVSFFSDGELMGTATTNEQGVAVFNTPHNYANGHRVYRADFDGDVYYVGSSATQTG